MPLEYTFFCDGVILGKMESHKLLGIGCVRIVTYGCLDVLMKMALYYLRPGRATIQVLQQAAMRTADNKQRQINLHAMPSTY